MKAQSAITNSTIVHGYTSQISKLYAEGIVAGVIGAATIAIWFLILDTINGHPLYTPTVLGTALFRGGEGLSHPEGPASSLEMTLMYTWVHVLAFAIVGGVASRLLGLAEENPNLGFGILLLFWQRQWDGISGAGIPILRSGLSPKRVLAK
ncbi:MAG: hypothetical protein HY695_33330 [Deltaproteobacteria bacterium]|nr:hypothetical protein [Deltaproteobacteria bacterium]